MMIKYFITVLRNKKIFYAIFTTMAVVAMSLSGCEKSGKNNPLVTHSVKNFTQTTTLSGSVSGGSGPVTTGKIVAADENGGIIATAALQSGGRYSLIIPAGTQLPIVLKAYPETGDGSEEILQAVVVEPSLKRYEINPLSTTIAEKAKALGGYTAENLMEAAMTSVAVPDANKTTGGFRGDPTKQYGGWH